MASQVPGDIWPFGVNTDADAKRYTETLYGPGLDIEDLFKGTAFETLARKEGAGLWRIKGACADGTAYANWPELTEEIMRHVQQHAAAGQDAIHAKKKKEK